MQANKLLHILLMSGCLTGCNEGDGSDKGETPSSHSPDANAQLPDASSDANALAADATHSDGGASSFEISACGPMPTDSEVHYCSFAGQASGEEACELVHGGKDLCCCWAPETC